MATDVERLRSLIDGELLLPEAPGYELAKQLQIAEYDAVRPSGIAYCASAADVSACVRFAAETGLHLAVRAGGHSFAGWSTTDGLVVDLSRMGEVGSLGEVVRLGAGARSVDAITALAPSDVQFPTGVCPTVCQAGYVSGGGIGWQTRQYGVASDGLVAAEVVLADGSRVRATDDQEADLFWALRGGGGGNFGVITALEVQRTHVPRIVNFTAVWSWDHALDALDRWQHWMAAAPRTISSEIGVVLPDAGSEAAPFVMMHGGHFGTAAEFEELFGALCLEVGARPVELEAEELPYEQAMLRLFRCEDKPTEQRRRVGTTPEGTLPRQGFLREGHRMLSSPLDRHHMAVALEAFEWERRRGQFRYFALTALGGAANEVGPAETAYVHRDALFLAKYTLIREEADPGPEDAAAASAWVDRGMSLLTPLSNGHSYVNYPDRGLTDWRWAYYGDNYPRLVDVKKSYDPGFLFTFPQGIGM
ncbi:FAD-binding oxidoreductase [Nocardiopsis listeri]|uniref:FAD-binding oxidoreductase n=1 Tax=Nocardiopsis listeri TaxID=53440 RepID=UPI000837A6B3|nr:FAD-binding oxidoreductase [Nocardiopsis listeri]